MNGSILISESFKLNGRTINVIVDDDYCREEKLWGEADFSLRIITLCNKSKGKVLRKKVKEVTFFHELVHQILHSIGKDKLKWDEDFVEAFADRLFEYEKTKK